MEVIYKHLITFFKEEPSIEELSNKLFQLGHENEIHGELLDIEFTPNRGDCLSVLGLARDLGVFYTFENKLQLMSDHIDFLDLDFTNNSIEDCPMISFLMIEIKDEIQEYKPYLQSYFDGLKLNKNNFFTDISNYVAYEIGQPTHCYDFSKVGKAIQFDKIELNQEFETLLGKKINLTGENCIFLSNDVTINLAGIIGGITTSCGEKTNSVLVECAYFRPESIIGKALKYDLNSDASYKFERGVNPEIQEYALRRFIKIVSDHAKIKNIQIYNNNYKNIQTKKIDYDISKINSILGFNISEDLYVEYLNKLGFEIQNNKIQVPSHRHDISHANDLAEEVARIIGYDNIVASEFKALDKIDNSFSSNELYIKDFLIDNGFNEVINNPFCEVESVNAICVDNPLDSNRRFLRTNLKESLVKNLIFNENRQKDSIKLFEITDIYDSKNKETINKFLGLIVSGRVAENYKDFSKKLDDKYIKNIFKEIDIELDSKLLQEVPRNELKTKQKSRVYFLQIKINEIPNSIAQYKKKKKVPESPFIQYKEISEFPSSTRDVSFQLSNEDLINELESILLNLKSKNLKKVFVFDFFKKSSINIKIGFRFIFQCNTSTLKVCDVDAEMESIMDQALSIPGIEIPGLTWSYLMLIEFMFSQFGYNLSIYPI